MAKKRSKKQTAAANSARRKQGPTKKTDYKNGRPVTAAAKKKRGASGGKGKSSGGGGGAGAGSSNPGTKQVTFAGGKSKGKAFYSKTMGKHVTVPGASSVRPAGGGSTRSAEVRAKQKKVAGAAFKQKYKQVTAELKDAGIKSSQWDKRAIRRHAQAAAVKANKRGGERMVKAYAKGVQKKAYQKGWKFSEASHKQFYKGYRRSLQQDFGV